MFPPLLEAEYLHKGLVVLLPQRFVFSPPFIHVFGYLVISV